MKKSPIGDILVGNTEKERVRTKEMKEEGRVEEKEATVQERVEAKEEKAALPIQLASVGDFDRA